MKTIISSLMNIGSALSRAEMKQIIAGIGDCVSGPISCEEFAKKTGCYPSDDPGDSCTGTDGCTYNTMTSDGSCGC